MPGYTHLIFAVERSPLVSDGTPTTVCRCCGDTMNHFRTIAKLGVRPEQHVAVGSSRSLARLCSIPRVPYFARNSGDFVREIGYVYDMGDNWQHRIIVEKIKAAEPGALYPQFLGGERRCPPEDC
jgi:hypothetical protein